jgi:cytochrome oxidase Cu insertion factor (SCO1/SenC/PrrC family)
MAGSSDRNGIASSAIRSGRERRCPVAIKRWLKWVLVGAGSLAVVVVLGFAGLLWFAASQMDLNVDVGDLAPNISMVNLDGERVSLADYRGRVVLVDFWSTW